MYNLNTYCALKQRKKKPLSYLNFLLGEFSNSQKFSSWDFSLIIIIESDPTKAWQKIPTAWKEIAKAWQKIHIACQTIPTVEMWTKRQ